MVYPSPLPIHEEALNRLKKGLAKSRLSHALILEGASEVYVQDLALHMAAEIFCAGQDGCEKDPRIFHLTHPNVKVIESHKSSIAKDDIIQLQHDFNQTSLEAGPKIYVILDAEKMNGYAANALLKFLEEPHANIYGILVTQDALSLLPTILSRSQLISVKSTSSYLVYDALLKDGYSRQSAHIASVLWPDVDRAKTHLDSEEFTYLINQIPALLTPATPSLSVLKKMRDFWPDMDRDKAQVMLFLDVTMLYLKDLLYAKLKVGDKALFSEHISTIEATAPHYDRAMLVTMWSHTLALKEKCEKPIHLSLALDNWALMMERGDAI